MEPNEPIEEQAENPGEEMNPEDTENVTGAGAGYGNIDFSNN